MFSDFSQFFHNPPIFSLGFKHSLYQLVVRTAHLSSPTHIMLLSWTDGLMKVRVTLLFIMQPAKFLFSFIKAGPSPWVGRIWLLMWEGNKLEFGQRTENTITETQSPALCQLLRQNFLSTLDILEITNGRHLMSAFYVSGIILRAFPYVYSFNIHSKLIRKA